MRHYIRFILLISFLSAALVACSSEAPSSDVVRQVIQAMGPSDRILKVTSLQYHCMVKRGSDGQKLKTPFYAYTVDVQAIKDGEAMTPPMESGYFIFQKANGGPWSALIVSLDAWNC